MIFVFGSNLAGRHGKGAALYALKEHGAEYGVGKGLQGNSYAIPTKDRYIKTLPLHMINSFVEEFLEFANERKDLIFNVTSVGTGLAGYKISEIAPMFKNRSMNVLLSEEFNNYIKENHEQHSKHSN